MNRISTIAAIAAIAVSLVGFTLLAVAWNGESTESAKEDVCTSLSELSSTVMSYDGLNPLTATNDELENAAEDIEEAWDDLVDETYDWVYAEDNALTEAYDDLYYAIQDLDGDNSLADNAEELEDELNAFPEAYQATFTGAGCSTSS
jgi:hypothetical protein